MYMDALYRLHGENNTDLLFQEWRKKSNVEGCPAIDPTECQLESLRFLGGGVNATCGVCNDTNYDASIVPAKCPPNVTEQIEAIDLWHNTESK